MFKAKIRCKIDRRNEKVGAKIRDAELSKIPFISPDGGLSPPFNSLYAW